MKKAVRFGILLILLVSVSSCTSDKEYAQIDFSNTIPAQKPSEGNKESGTLRVAVAAMISPKETFVYYKELIHYLGEAVDKDIRMVQRKTYKEINEMFLKDDIDLAFICSGPYALEKYRYRFQAIATPVVRGSPFYQSYLIVNKQSQFKKLTDLRQHTFAFSDPNSNTGALVPTYWLYQLGATPDTFFSKTHFTYSHDNSILAVAKSLVDAAAVEGHKWEYFHANNDINASKTRVIKKSEKFGSPPLVASNMLPDSLKEKIQEAALSMHAGEKGKQILNNLMIDRFSIPEEKWYRPIRAMKEQLANPGS
ncbi:MAG: phosphate/phosphite/phosphonate ABC transporter substrate-binding protein [Proteobacteria bacterium]|nr:phosphate/phosphite/phosphonate ABC transporter substrate-binding protein [Pseudomonadota bacterium]